MKTHGIKSIQAAMNRRETLIAAVAIGVHDGSADKFSPYPMMS